MTVTAALVILLSAFNGIEKMVIDLYSDFDTDLTIRSKTRKTFYASELPINQFAEVPSIANVSRAIEETVILKHEDKWAHAQLIGVDGEYITMTRMDEHMVDGSSSLEVNNTAVGLIGASLLDKLHGFIPRGEFEQVLIYAPKRDMKMKLGKKQFDTRQLLINGRYNFNKEVNASSVVVPLELAKSLLHYNNELSAIYLEAKPGSSLEEAKKTIQEMVPKEFVVKTNLEKNALIFQTSQTEKRIVIVILVFIFLLASFNLITSITMQYVEKRQDLYTLRSFGFTAQAAQKLFFLEGMLVAIQGIIFGLAIGYGVCFAQMKFALLEMPNSYGEPFPLVVQITDAFLIIFLVLFMSGLINWFTSRNLIKNQGL